jgi:predicted AlkP superfamily phosphohydrolase/phosphomutase
MATVKVLVIGLDGCSWTLLEPWLAAGELPVLARLRARGAWGEAESCLPPVTAPNWKCYSTGRNPGRLGVYWWENVDYAGRRFVAPRSTSFDGPEIWDYLGEAGFRCGVVNMPTLYPPKRIQGFLVGGGPDAGEEGFASPPEAEALLRAELGYRVHSRFIHLIDYESERVAREIHGLIESRFRAADTLLAAFGPVDFLQVTVYYINVLQHHFWDHPWVLEGWRIIDQEIGRLLEKFPEVDVFLVVDHGTNEIRWKFNICSWLAREGYLVLRRDPLIGALRRVAPSRETVAAFVSRLGLKDFVKRVTNDHIRSMLPTRAGTVWHEARARLIDWGASRAVASGQGPVYVNPALSGDERSRVLEQLIASLSTLEAPDGHFLARRVLRRDEAYAGPHLERAPDLVIDQNDGIHISGAVGFADTWERPSKWRGENHRTGLFLAAGPRIIPGRLSDPMQITDVAPTILELFGLDPGAGMDGRPRRDLLGLTGAHAATRAAPFQGDATMSADEDDPRVAQRLRDLGYL